MYVLIIGINYLISVIIIRSHNKLLKLTAANAIFITVIDKAPESDSLKGILFSHGSSLNANVYRSKSVKDSNMLKPALISMTDPGSNVCSPSSRSLREKLYLKMTPSDA